VADASIGKAAAVAVPPVGVDHRRNSSIDLDRALYKFLYKAKYGMQVIDSKREGVAPHLGHVSNFCGIKSRCSNRGTV
jgi:hypothetical protein